MREQEIARDGQTGRLPAVADDTRWLSTNAACRRLGITVRTLYRLVNEGQIPAYRFGRVYRLKEDDVDRFIESSRIEPGTLDHLYPEPRKATSDTEASGT
jgi:excisionase family DNA binding protein